MKQLWTPRATGLMPSPAGAPLIPALTRLPGSSRSRTASPSSVAATTTSTSATPGAAATHGALTSVSRPEAIRLPHDGVGGCTPEPEKREPRLEQDGVAQPERRGHDHRGERVGQDVPHQDPRAPARRAPRRSPRTAAPPAPAPPHGPAARSSSTR